MVGVGMGIVGPPPTCSSGFGNCCRSALAASGPLRLVCCVSALRALEYSSNIASLVARRTESCGELRFDTTPCVFETSGCFDRIRNQDRRQQATARHGSNKCAGLPRQESAFRTALHQQHNLHVLYMQGDGNCLFRSVAHHIYGSQDSHGRVRREVCDYIDTNRSRFDVSDPNAP